MPNTKSAERRARSNERKHQRNAAVKSRLRTMEKKFLDARQTGDKAAIEAAFREVSSALDKAAKGGVIPKTRANRKKSRLARTVVQK